MSPFNHLTKDWVNLKLPDIFPAKLGLFEVSKKLQFGVCNYDEPCANPCRAKEGQHFYRGGKGNWESYSKQRVPGFSLAEFLPGKKKSLSSPSTVLPFSQSVGVPLLIS